MAEDGERIWMEELTENWDRTSNTVGHTTSISVLLFNEPIYFTGLKKGIDTQTQHLFRMQTQCNICFLPTLPAVYTTCH